MMYGDTLGSPHGTIPAAVITNQNKSIDPLRAKKTFIRMKMDQTVQFRKFSSVTLFSCHGMPEKETYCNLESLIYAGDLKTGIYLKWRRNSKKWSRLLQFRKDLLIAESAWSIALGRLIVTKLILLSQ